MTMLGLKLYLDYVIIGRMSLVYGFYWIDDFEGELNKEFVYNRDYACELLVIPTSKYELFNPEVKSKILLLLGDVDSCYENLVRLMKYFFLVELVTMDCSVWNEASLPSAILHTSGVEAVILLLPCSIIIPISAWFDSSL